MSKKLIELTTNLKSLKYNSGEKPYVVKDINNPPSTNGLVREVTARVDDLSRISQMLVDAPGAKYLAHEAMLQQIGVQNRIKNSGDKPLRAVLNEIGKTVVGTTKIVASTLAQVPVNGTGTHFIKGFKTDTYLQPSENNSILSSIVNFFGKEGTSGATYSLNGKEVPVNKAVSYLDSRQSPLDYTGTYRDIYETGSTSNWSKPVDTVDIPVVLPGGITNFPVNFSAKDYVKQGKTVPTSGSKLDHDSTGQPTGNATEIQNINGSYKGPAGYSKDFTMYSENNPFLENGKIVDESLYNFSTKEEVNTRSFTNAKERRVGLGDQGAKVQGRKIIWNSPDKSEYEDTVADKINSRVNQTPDQSGDLVVLYFHNINTKKYVQFRAFIDSIDDSYNAEWQGTKYVGRAEEFYTYGGFSRDISITFKIAAATSVEMFSLYEKMNQLAAMTAPNYNTAGIMQGTVVKMNVGYYITNTPGIITSVKYSLVEDAPWEIGLLDPSLNTMLGTSPTILQCSVSFKAIHDFAPQNTTDNYFGDINKTWKGIDRNIR